MPGGGKSLGGGRTSLPEARERGCLGSRHRERRGWLRLGAGFPKGDQTSEAQSQTG